MFDNVSAHARRRALARCGINKNGEIVGRYVDSNGINHGYYRTPAGAIKTFDPKGSTGTYTPGINDSGDFAGGYYDSNGLEHGFLRTP